MKRSLLITALLIVVSTSFAQQRPHYTQYILNNYILNPALSGIENYTDLKMSARDQWVGLNGSPKTFYLSVHGPIGKKDYKTTATSFNMPGENPRGNAYWENYTASEPHHGIGFSMISDKTGLYNRFTADVSYAYHLGISSRTNIAAGFSGGISKISYDRTKATPVDPNDPALVSGSGPANIYKIVPDLNAGIWIYSSDYFIGLAAQQIMPQKVSFTDVSEGFKLLPHFFATTGYRFLLNDDINAIPSVMVKYVAGSPVTPQFDINVKLQYMDLLWVGGSYRLQDGYAAMIGLNVGNTFNVGYSYDITTTKLNTVSRGTHELVLGFLIGNRYKDTCPRNVW
ncbi:MAG TPA: type IX secretion system membrane protein PorP/SprF [Chitinophagaceae bacterium]|jgi:type IX secretion system PorP/SprF family membrane protein|nr:type IX secretion system membrane protein PorP/SprF [Chitinophagaceae bacterium]